LDWKYILTLKEGRQPTTWQETLKLLPLHRENLLRLRLGRDGKEGLQDFRWVENVLVGSDPRYPLGRNYPRDSDSLRVYH